MPATSVIMRWMYADTAFVTSMVCDDDSAAVEAWVAADDELLQRSRRAIQYVARLRRPMLLMSLLCLLLRPAVSIAVKGAGMVGSGEGREALNMIRAKSDFRYEMQHEDFGTEKQEASSFF